MSDDRIKQLSKAGMRFKPGPPMPDHKARIDALTAEQFANLLSLASVLSQEQELDKPPTFLSFNLGLQQRSFQEP